MFTRCLDGEFAIVIVDRVKQQLIITCDPFRLRRLFVSLQEPILVTDRYSKLVNHTTIVTPVENLCSVYCLKTFKLIDTAPVKRFLNVGYKQTYDDWVAAFKQAVLKRIDASKKMYISLSSGYDSGAIFLEAIKTGASFGVFSDLRDANAKDIVSRRLQLTDKCEFVEVDSSPRSLNQAIDFIRQTVDVGGYLYEIKDVPDNAHLYICRGGEVNYTNVELHAVKAGYSIHLTGLGCDNVMDPQDWHSPRQPTGARSAEYIYTDYISSELNVDVRLPFLDAQVVQEYLLLSANLKTDYKAPIKYLFEQENFPFEEGIKYGFALPHWEKDAAFYQPCWL